MIINGEKASWEAGLTVEKLLETRNYRTDRVAVEKNGEIVPKKNYCWKQEITGQTGLL